MFDIVKSYSESINDGRTKHKVLASLMEEVGELSTEVNISEGLSYKEPSVDGVVGEAIDVIACALDLIYLENPNITQLDIEKIISLKCSKWKQKSVEIKVKNTSNTVRNLYTKLVSFFSSKKSKQVEYDESYYLKKEDNGIGNNDDVLSELNHINKTLKRIEKHIINETYQG